MQIADNYSQDKRQEATEQLKCLAKSLAHVTQSGIPGF